jgi:hypothetical protein
VRGGDLSCDFVVIEVFGAVVLVVSAIVVAITFVALAAGVAMGLVGFG